jgi:flagellar hook assembly protein FlgD
VSDVRSVPNPFSPVDGPATILFELSSDAARMPFVTARIYNMAARPVRELMIDQPQAKGTVSVEWDGLTDAGEKARNGRYVVEVRARDTGGEETALGTLVLIK